MGSSNDIKIASSADNSDNEELPSKNPAFVNIAPTEIPPKIPPQYADESYKLFSQLGEVSDPTPEEARAIRNKCVKWILPFICIGYHVMYVDK